MVNSIANISTLLSNGDDLLKESGRRNPVPEETVRELESISVDESFQNQQDVAENIKAFADELSNYIGDENLSLEFSKDDETKQMIMKLVNGKTNEVVKQFPPEISLKIARILSGTQSGNLANAKV